jgi:hypothetical protein
MSIREFTNRLCLAQLRLHTRDERPYLVTPRAVGVDLPQPVSAAGLGGAGGAGAAAVVAVAAVRLEGLPPAPSGTARAPRRHERHAPAGLQVKLRLPRRGLQEKRVAVPMAEQQGHFDIEPIVGDRLTPPCPSAPHSVLHGVEIQGELLGRRITRAAVEKHSKCFPQPHRFRRRRPDLPAPRRPRHGRPRYFRTPAPRPRAQDHHQPRQSAVRPCAVEQPIGPRLLEHAIEIL